MNNSEKWEAFLKLGPVEANEQPERTKENFDTKTIKSKPCMALDLAKMLNKKIIVDEKEHKDYKDRKANEETTSVDRQVKTEAVDEIGYGGENDYEKSDEVAGKSLAGGDSKPIVEILFSDIQPDYPGSITSASPKDKPGVDDRSTPVSKWTFKMFVDYFDFDEYVRELNLPFDDWNCGQTTGEEDLDLNVLFDKILRMFGYNSLKDCMLREIEVRVLLDVILKKLCKEHELLVHMEYKYNMQYLPTGKFDYLITTRDGVPLGCVEAKSSAGFEKKSFCQAVLELILVQDLAAKKGVDVEKTPVFCILSDGYRYILMQLKGRELFLEHDSPKAPTSPTTKVIKLGKLDEQVDFLRLSSSITILIIKSMLSTSMKNFCKLS